MPDDRGSAVEAKRAELAARINRYLRDESWLKARRLLREALRAEPGSHWLVTKLATTYYEAHHYREALAINRKALRMAPRCPLALWNHACSLDMLGEEARAIAIWKRLLVRGVDSIAGDPCGEGLRWAQSLLNDCRYRVGLSYMDLGQRARAKRYLLDHLENRRPGIPSLYRITDVRRKLKHRESNGGKRSGINVQVR